MRKQEDTYSKKGGKVVNYWSKSSWESKLAKQTGSIGLIVESKKRQREWKWFLFLHRNFNKMFTFVKFKKRSWILYS